MSWAEVKMAVKSIQRGYTTVTNSDVTITLGKSVDPSRCIVLLDGDCGMWVNSNRNTTTYNYYTPNGYIAKNEYSGGYDFSYYDSYGYAAARKPYVKTLTATQLIIGQSGTYSAGNNGTTVSYQVIEFFN